MVVAEPGALRVERFDERTRTAREVAQSHSADLPGDTLLSVYISEASTLTDAQRFKDALQRADDTLQLWRNQGEPPRQDIISLYGIIALAAEGTGDIARAEKAYKDAIDYADRFFDKPNPGSAWNVGMYGTFLIAQGRFAEAEPYARRGLEMRRTVFGDNDPRTLNAVAGMGKLYAGTNQFDAAIDWYSHGIDVCEKTGLVDIVCPRLLSNRARALSGQRRRLPRRRLVTGKTL